MHRDSRARINLQPKMLNLSGSISTPKDFDARWSAQSALAQRRQIGDSKFSIFVHSYQIRDSNFFDVRLDTVDLLAYSRGEFCMDFLFLFISQDLKPQNKGLQ